MLGASMAPAGAVANKGNAIYKFKKYVGGHGKANRKLSPITIGIVNQQTSTNAIAPEWSSGAAIAQHYINQQTHGLDGHPLKLNLCKIATSVSTASKCGAEFANDSNIAAIAAGIIDIGNTALESALLPSGKPIIWGVSLSTVDERFKNGFILEGAVSQVEAPIATFAYKYLHAKSVSLTYPSNIPAEVQSANTIANALTYEGAKVYKVGFTSAETNLTAPFEAAHVQTTKMLVAVNSGGPACSDTYHSLQALHLTTKVKVIVNVPCDTPTIAKADGGTLPHNWYYSTAQPLPGSPTKSVKVFDKIATKYGHKTTGLNNEVFSGFAQVLTIAKWYTELLKAGRKITPTSVRNKAKHFKGPMVQGPGRHKLRCGQFAGMPAVCDNLDSLFQNTAPNKFVPIAWWVGPPKGFKITLTTS